MNSHYQIRIQAILAADDDGSTAATITVDGIKQRLEVANDTFSSANISFIFDETTDLLRINSTLINRTHTIFDPPDVDGNKWSEKPRHDDQSHNEARTRLARMFPGKLVIFFRKATKLKETDGGWADGSKNWSGWSGPLVNMTRGGDDNLITLAHELGHYLQIRHSHSGGSETVAAAAAKIKKYIEDNGLPISKGLEALDGDRVWVTDTPADADDKIFTNAGQDPCGPNGELSIPVTFSNNTTHVYTLAPERSNVMSYFMDCPGVPPTISPQQARRVRDGLEMGGRHHLISLKPRFDYTIVQGSGSGIGEPINKLDVAMVRAGRVATAVRRPDGKLKVIVWDVEDNGNQIIRRGEMSAGEISNLTICGMGLDMIATPVITTDELKVIIWRIDEDGEVEREGSASIAGQFDGVAVCRVGIEYLATAVRNEDGELQVAVWRLNAKGQITHRGGTSAGAINTPGEGALSSMPRLAMNAVGKQSFVTHVRDGSHHLKAILWTFDDDKPEKEKVTRVGSVGGDEQQVVAIAGCALEPETSVAAVRDANGNLKLISYNFPDDGDRVSQHDTESAGDINDVAICPMGTEMCVTGVRGSGNRLKVILWQVSKNGYQVVRRDDSTGEDITRLAMCYAGSNQFVTAARETGGNLKIRAWRLRTARALGVNQLSNGFKAPVEPTHLAFTAQDEAAPDLKIRCDSEPNGSAG